MSGFFKMTVEECIANDGHCWDWPGKDGRAFATYEGAPNTRWCKHCGFRQIQEPAQWREAR